MTAETENSIDLKERLRLKFVAALREWRWRTRKKRSKAEFAQAVGVDPSCVTCWCNGISFPKWSKLELVSEVLGVSLEWWMSENTDVVPSTGSVKFSEDQKETIAKGCLMAKFKLDLTWSEMAASANYSVSSVRNFITPPQDGTNWRTDRVADALYCWLKNEVPRLESPREDIDPNQGVIEV